MSLATKYRPAAFEDVVGQNIATTILKKIILEKKIKNCILLAGASGCGKTTIARIIANMVNNNIGAPIEIDAASQNSVDNVRAIINAASERDLVGEYKIFIIDEAHMITTAGWNAFLKTIEEPPTYTIFIFCTTDPQKIPTTILNRLQRYNLSKISMTGIKNRLLYICHEEGFINYEDTCDFISKISQGGMRTAITMLEQCADYSTDLSINNTKLVLGDLSYDTFFNLTCYVLNKDRANILALLENCHNTGTDLKLFIDRYLAFCIDLEKYCLFKEINITEIPSYLEPRCAGFSNLSRAIEYLDLITTMLLELKPVIKLDISYKTTIEAYFINLLKEI